MTNAVTNYIKGKIGEIIQLRAATTDAPPPYDIVAGGVGVDGGGGGGGVDGGGSEPRVSNLDVPPPALAHAIPADIDIQHAVPAAATAAASKEDDNKHIGQAGSNRMGGRKSRRKHKSKRKSRKSRKSRR